MVSIRIRLFITFFILFGFGLYQLTTGFLEELRPRYLATMEEVMVDIATLLAAQVSTQVIDGQIPTNSLSATFDEAGRRAFAAKIYEMTKTRLSLRVYITDAKGVVIFDSDNGRAVGEDYAQWNDVYNTMRGEYGARSTRLNPDDPKTSSLFVASPIKANGEIIGVLTVCKSVDSVTLFLETAENNAITTALTICLAIVLLGIVVSSWITAPINRLTRYARAIRDGKRVKTPNLGRNEIGELGRAFEEMKTAVEGKQYVENYVQSLTHQMKSPLSAIRGAAELLDEELPTERRNQFVANIRSEADRIQDLIDRMLQLAALESRSEPRDVGSVDVTALVEKLAGETEHILAAKKIHAEFEGEQAVVVEAEAFLIRQALSNLIQNAVDFSPAGGTIRIKISRRGSNAVIAIADQGCGIPDYALDQVFERFYSLPRPDTDRKSSGLGLPFVSEVAQLHGGKITVENQPCGGVCATLVLPMRRTRHDT